MRKAVTGFVQACQFNCQSDNHGNSVPHGLRVIDMPTGAGKTTIAIRLNADFIRDNVFPCVQRIIFISPQNKNVGDPYARLKEALADSASLFEKDCLWLQANYKPLVDNFDKVKNEIPDELRSMLSFKKLESAIHAYNSFENGPSYIEVEKALRKNVDDSDRVFRRDVKRYISTSKGDSKRLYGEEFQWLTSIYPSARVPKSKVIFMSVDKFLLPCDPIVDKPFNFYDPDFLKNTLIFIDEFDASKPVVLGRLIDQSSSKKIDLVTYLTLLWSSLSNKEVPESLERNEQSRAALAKLKTKVKACWHDNRLDYQFKLEDQNGRGKCFLFQSGGVHFVLNNGKRASISVHTDEKRKQNIIRINDKASDSRPFGSLISSLRGILKYSIQTFSMVARNYLNDHNAEANKTNGDRMTLDKAILTVLKLFDLSGNEAIKDMVLRDYHEHDRNKPNRLYRESFYPSGFYYIDFIDDQSHNLTTTFNFCSLDDTPERFMLSLCSSAMVVGLSATGTIDTVTGNYDLEYLKNQLGRSYIPLTDDDKARMASSLSKNERDYPTNVMIMEAKETDEEQLAKLVFADRDHIDDFANYLRYFDPSGNTDSYFQKQRFVRLVLAIKQFIANPDGKVILTLTNNVLKADDCRPFDKKSVVKIVKDLCDELGLNQGIDVYDLHGVGFDSEKDRYKRDIKEGKKAILISSYPSSGTGQNLQYSTEDEAGVSVEKDIDSLYLENPTNILLNLNNYCKSDSQPMTEESLKQYIYQAECLVTRGEISHDYGLKMLENGFRVYSGNRRRDYDNGEYRADSVNNQKAAILIQAIGRISRTRSNKKSHRNIYIDQDIVESVDFQPVADKLLSKEVRDVIAVLPRKENNPEAKLNRWLVEASNRSNEIANTLDKHIKADWSSWSASSMQEWKSLRQWVLAHPTCSAEELKNHPEYYDLYYHYPSGKDNRLYCSSLKSDEVMIGLTKTKKTPACLSESECRLDEIARVPEIRKLFVAKGYALSFESNEFILLPSVYTNIYKGALGEAAGLAVFSACCLRLDEIDDPEKFERFDFALREYDGVYVDFKLWKGEMEGEGEKHLQKAESKCRQIGARQVFIVNVLSDDDDSQNLSSGSIYRVPGLLRRQGESLAIDQTRIIDIFNELTRGGEDDGHHQ